MLILFILSRIAELLRFSLRLCGELNSYCRTKISALSAILIMVCSNKSR